MPLGFFAPCVQVSESTCQIQHASLCKHCSVWNSYTLLPLIQGEPPTSPPAKGGPKWQGPLHPRAARMLRMLQVKDVSISVVQQRKLQDGQTQDPSDQFLLVEGPGKPVREKVKMEDAGF